MADRTTDYRRIGDRSTVLKTVTVSVRASVCSVAGWAARSKELTSMVAVFEVRYWLVHSFSSQPDFEKMSRLCPQLMMNLLRRGLMA